MPVSREQVQGLLKTCEAVRDAIKELGEVPSGHLYNVFMQAGVDLRTYEQIIGLIVESGVVRKRGDLLIWVGTESK